MFKVGDKVKGINADIKGCEGIIEEVREEGYSIRLTKVGNLSWHGIGDMQIGSLIERNTFWGNCLELISSKPTKPISKKQAMEQILETYYEWCNSFIENEEKKLKENLGRGKLELEFLKKIERQKLIQNADIGRRKNIEGMLKNLKPRSEGILLAKKNISKETISSDFKALTKNSLIEKVEVEGDYLNIFTTKLKVKGKYNIGNYHIKLLVKNSIGPLNPRIENLEGRPNVNGYHYDHWYVRKTSPCLSQWEPTLNGYFKKGNLLLAVNNIIHFLLTASGGGYLQWYNWLEKFSGERVERGEVSQGSEGVDTAARVFIHETRALEGHWLPGPPPSTGATGEDAGGGGGE